MSLWSHREDNNYKGLVTPGWLWRNWREFRSEQGKWYMHNETDLVKAWPHPYSVFLLPTEDEACLPCVLGRFALPCVQSDSGETVKAEPPGCLKLSAATWAQVKGCLTVLSISDEL